MNGLSVVIPSRNAVNLIPCVAAVKRHDPDVRIFVIDDGLTFIPEGVEALTGIQPFVFARNCNLGIVAAGDDDVILLNDDALLESAKGFSLMQSAAQERTEFGVISAATNISGNPMQRPQFGSDSLRALGKTPGNSFPRVAFVCVLIPHRTIQSVGLMDERFGGTTPAGKLIYGHCDDDYCRRAYHAGFRIGVHDGCFVDHAKLDSTFRTQPIDMDASRKLYLEKWGSM